MLNINLPSISNLPAQNLSIINLPPIQNKSQESNDMLFPCTICPKSFSRKNSLLRHLRIHSGSKPYTCEICSKSFSRKDILTRHKESIKCIKKAKATSSFHNPGSSDNSSVFSPLRSPVIQESRMSISSIISETSDFNTWEQESLQSNEYNIYPLYSLKLSNTQLVLPSKKFNLEY